MGLKESGLRGSLRSVSTDVGIPDSGVTFEEYTTGDTPGDWTVRWASADADWNVREDSELEGGKYLEQDAPQQRNAISWDDIGTATDIEVFFRGRAINAGTNSDILGGRVRGSGGDGTETGYTARLQTDGGIGIGKYVDGNFSEVQTGSFSMSENTLYNVRFRAEDSDLKLRVWEDGTEEPSSWTVEATDSEITDAGWAGLGHFRDNVGDYDVFSYATGGDSAPVL